MTNINKPSYYPEDSTPLQVFEEIAPELESDSRELKVTLVNWLWAARFFKTRALAREAIESGDVLVNGENLYSNSELSVGDKVSIEQGRNVQLVYVKGLSSRRRSAKDAMSLFDILDTKRKNLRNSRFLRKNKDMVVD